MRLFLASLFLATASACTIQSLHLVKTTDGSDIMTLPVVEGEFEKDPEVLMANGKGRDFENVEEHGKEITVRAQASGCSFIKFDIDGRIQRVEGGELGSFYAAGMSDDGKGKVFKANTISKRGPHTVTACPNENGFPFINIAGREAQEEDMDGCVTVQFKHGDPPVSPFAGGKKHERDPEPPKSFVYGRVNGEKVNGEYMKYHKVTVAFSGPPASETGMTIPGTYRPPSVFPDYRLDCTFKHESGKEYVVPGYFAGDGDPGRDGSIAGSTWLCHFGPDDTGMYEWTADFRQGTNVAQNGGGNPGEFFDQSKGKFKVGESNKQAPDLRSKGRLRSVGMNHLQFDDDEYFLKVGPDSPQNLLAYDDIDDTPNKGLYRKNYFKHEDDYDFDNDPTFGGGLGTGLVGAINYLSSKGMNAMSVTLQNIEGDDGNVFPFIAPDRHLYYDISKLAQWGVIFEHAQAKGITLRMKLQDAAGEYVLDSEERKLFYREMIARYGYNPAIVWDLGEDLEAEKLEEYSKFIKETDPYKNPIAVRAWDQKTLDDYVKITTIDAISLHSDYAGVNKLTQNWVKESNLSRLSFAVSSDEQGDLNTGVKPESEYDEDKKYDDVREEVLWGNLMGGGAGVQYFFGMSYDENDLTCQDFRSRETLWDQSKYAVDFFRNNAIPFQNMKGDNTISEGNLCLAGGSFVVVYKKSGTVGVIANLPGNEATSYEVEWYNPRTGVQTAQGSVSAGQGVDLGSGPDSDDKDWVIFLSCANC